MDHEGAPLEHLCMVFIQALSMHIQQITALADELGKASIRNYRKQCTQCSCANERERSLFRASECRPRRCSIALLLRAGGKLQIDVVRHSDGKEDEAEIQLVCPPGTYPQQGVRRDGQQRSQMHSKQLDRYS